MKSKRNMLGTSKGNTARCLESKQGLSVNDSLGLENPVQGSDSVERWADGGELPSDPSLVPSHWFLE